MRNNSMRKITILTILVILIISCNRPTNKPIAVTEVNNVEQQFGKVIITGKSDDLEAFKTFNVNNLSSFSIQMENYRDHIEVINDSLFLVIDSISSPQFISIHASTSTAFYNGELIINPKDTVIFEIKNKKLKFIGKNANQNNFYASLYDSIPKYIDYNHFQGDIYAYKEKVDSLYSEKMNFLNQYVKKNKLTSVSFINALKLDLKYQHLRELVGNETNGLISIIQKEYNNQEKIVDFKDYLGNISIDDFKNENHLNLLSFKITLFSLIRNYFETSDNKDYSKEKLIAEKKFIDNNFEAKIKEYLTVSLIFNYHIKGFGHSENSVSFLNKIILEFEEKYPKSSFIKDLQEIKEDLDSYNFELPEAALDAKFVNQIGDTLTLRNIFARSNKRIKVVDFWASWCLPCVSQIKEGKAFKDRLLVENNVEWIYLSIDENQEQWLKKSKEFEVLNFSNSFFLLNGKNAALAKYLEVSWIPRYVIFNQKNKIVLNIAPSPSDEKIFEEIIDDIDGE
jgi:thiol-disulfide isomerase/thioredoxin